MKPLLLLLLALPASPQGMGCSSQLKPLRPVGCADAAPSCVCGASSCSWVWICADRRPASGIDASIPLQVQTPQVRALPVGSVDPPQPKPPKPEKLSKRDPSPEVRRAQNHYWRGEKLMEQARYGEAIVEYEKALVIEPNHLVITQRLELARERARDADTIQALRKTVEDLKRRVEALESRANQ